MRGDILRNRLSVSCILLAIFTGCVAEFETTGSETSSEASFSLTCAEQDYIGVFRDLNGDGVIQQDDLLGNITVYDGTLSTADEYNYYSFSAHFQEGPELKPFVSTFYLYDGKDGLSLIFAHNKDDEGFEINHVEMVIRVSGNEASDNILVADEGNEFVLVDNNIPSSEVPDYLTHFNPMGFGRYYHQDTHYLHNTDGGAIGPFEGNWSIAVNPLELGDILSLQIYSSTDESVKITSGEPFVVQPYQACP